MTPLPTLLDAVFAVAQNPKHLLRLCIRDYTYYFHNECVNSSVLAYCYDEFQVSATVYLVEKAVVGKAKGYCWHCGNGFD